MNCQRSNLSEEALSLLPAIDDDTIMENYVLDLHLCVVPDSSFRRKFCNTQAVHHEEVPGRNPRDRARSVRLCRKCSLYLASSSEQHEQNAKPAILPKLVWPAMIWRWLKTSRRTAVWLILPQLWRAWWQTRMMETYPALAGILQESRLCVVDATEKKYLLERAIKRNKLAELERVVNEHMLPTIKCPPRVLGNSAGAFPPS